MAQTPTTLSSVLKERWTDDEIQKQWLADDSPLSRFEQQKATMIGRQAQTPIWGNLNSGGFTSIGAGGGSINTASNQGTDQAAWTLAYLYFPIAIEISTLNQSESNLQAVISGKNLEVRGAIASVRNQGTRMLVTNGDSKVATCGAATSAAIPLTAAASEGTAYGYSALRRNWLGVGSVVDVGVVGDTDSIATAATVTAISKSSTAPTITTSAGSVTVDTSTFVYIANPNSTTAANVETNGLRNIINSSGALGGVNPATAGQEYWQAALRDTSTTVLSLDLMLNLTREVLQNTGEEFANVWTGFKQQMNFYSLLQNQVRFPGEMKLGAGNYGGVTWGNQKVEAYAAILDTDLFTFTLSDFRRIVGDITKPTWYSSLAGMTQAQIPTLGTTALGDQLVFPYQVGVARRNGASAATALQ